MGVPNTCNANERERRLWCPWFGEESEAERLRPIDHVVRVRLWLAVEALVCLSTVCSSSVQHTSADQMTAGGGGSSSSRLRLAGGFLSSSLSMVAGRSDARGRRRGGLRNVEMVRAPPTRRLTMLTRLLRAGMPASARVSSFIMNMRCTSRGCVAGAVRCRLEGANNMRPFTLELGTMLVNAFLRVLADM